MKNNLENLEDKDQYNDRKNAFDEVYKLQLIILKAEKLRDKLRQRKKK